MNVRPASGSREARPAARHRVRLHPTAKRDEIPGMPRDKEKHPFLTRPIRGRRGAEPLLGGGLIDGFAAQFSWADSQAK